jgi:hypothetical protein
MVQKELFPSTLFLSHLLLIFHILTSFFEIIFTSLFSVSLQKISFSLFFCSLTIVSFWSCLFCYFVFIETKDQTTENILIAIERNFSFERWKKILFFGFLNSFQNKNKIRQQGKSLNVVKRGNLTAHRYLELPEETSHSLEFEEEVEE